jgi:predicted helicase
MIRALFERLVTPSHVRSLGLEELLSLTGEVLNRVDTSAFFQRFEEDTAVQYFYEPFLEAFDPELRKQLGVWYTPREIVRYMVERVDTVLRTELGLPSGLADPNVYVLDPACGTGAYLVEVLDRIHRTLKEERGEDALTPQQLKQAAKERVFGFEILPAPYVIAHLQLGMYLQRAHAPLTEEHEGKRERAGVYLTNALTGWEPPDKQKARLPFQEFEEEREEADTVKRDKPILVVLGNPPYNAFAGVSPTEEDGLVEPYKEGLIKDWGIKKFNLDDLYIRFFRLAERRIAEKSHRGVVCFISNMSWVREPSFVVLRKHLFNAFNKVWIENLHGNRKISEYAPDGRTSETVFAVAGFSPGIQQGVATTLWVKSGDCSGAEVLFRDDHNAAKAEDRRKGLLESLNAERFNSKYTNAFPTAENRYSFWPEDVSDAYSEWPKITDLCAESPSNGLMEKRGGALIDCDREKLEERMRLYHDKSLDWDAYRLASSTLTGDWSGFDARKLRGRALDVGFRIEQVVRYAVRPFDTRWCYFTDISSIWNRSRPALWAQRFEGNRFLATRPAGVANPEGYPFMFTAALGDNDALRGHAYYFPLDLKQNRPEAANGHLFGADDSTQHNYSPTVARYLETLGETAAQSHAADIWLHTLAIGYSPAYLEENADGIRQDWPRIPLPSSLEQFRASAALGQCVAELLDTEQPVAGVTAGALRPELRSVAGLKRMDDKPLDADEDLRVTAGWGHAGKEGVTMPGRGKLVRRERTANELSELSTGLAVIGISQDEGLKRLGNTVVDVYLNDLCAWTNVPEMVWELYIGGYQVMKKWLSYREFSLLKRPLTLAEAEEVQAMARRLTALCLLQTELDANYRKVKSATWQPASETLRE